MTDTSQWVLKPTTPDPSQPQVFTNTSTGQQVYGKMLGGMAPHIFITLDQRTGQRVPNANTDVLTGQSHPDDSLKSFLLESAGLVAGGVGAGLAAGAGGAAAAGGASATPSITATSLTGAAPAAAGAIGGASDFLSKLNSGVNIAGGLAKGIADNQNAAAQRGLTQGSQALNATQLDPFTQQRARQKQALLSGLVDNYKPVTYQPGGYSGGANDIGAALKSLQPFTGQDAMAGAEGAFGATATGATGGKYVPPTATGYNPDAKAKLIALLSGQGGR